MVVMWWEAMRPCLPLPVSITRYPIMHAQHGHFNLIAERVEERRDHQMELNCSYNVSSSEAYTMVSELGLGRYPIGAG